MLPAMDTVGDDALLWMWYGFMLVVTAVDALALARVVSLHDPEPSARAYSRKMTALALPFVFQCSFRSVFPNQYAPRLVFWGTGLSSILLARCLVCVGELCWIAQI